MSHKIFLLVTSLFLALALSFSVSTPVLAAPPANDNFADATAITSLPFSASADSTDATSEAGEPFTCGFPVRTLWYSFTPTQDMAVQVDIVGVISGTITVYVSSGPAISDLAFFGCASQNNPVNLNVEAGKTYYLQVADFDQPGVLEFSLQQIFPPANDSFANAEVITSLPFNVAMDNTNATTELGEPFACASNRTVWYSFTPTQDMTVRVNMVGGALGAITVYVSSGPAISDLTGLRCVAPNSPANLNLEAGKTYYLFVADSGQPSVMEFNLQQIFPPANDNFANATSLTSLPFSASVDSTNTTNEPGEPTVCSLSTATVWYSFTPTQDMAVQVNILGAPTPSVVSVYLSSGPGISDLTFLQCASQNNPVNLNVEAGKTYYLQVDDSGLPGVMEFNLQQIFPPENDNFANAEVITSLPFSASVDNSDSTSEPGESIFCGTSRTLWYSFTPTQDMTVRVETVGVTSGAVSVYISTGPGISNLTHLQCASQDNTVNLNLEAGKTYYLQMTDFGQPDALEFNLQQIFPPANDNFANAEIITSLPFSTTVNNTDATTEPGENSNCGFLNRSVWYSFTPTQNMAVRVDMTDSAVPSRMNFYLASGPTISDLTFLACVTHTNSINFQVEAGKTYYLQVDAEFGQTGSIPVNLVQITPPANDDFVDAEAITSLPFSTTVDSTNATTEVGEPASCGFLLNTLWYSFTPAQNMEVRADMTGSATSGGLAIYLSSGQGLSGLIGIGCVNSASPSNFFFEGGNTYYLQVGLDSMLPVPGNIQLNLEQAIPPATEVNIDIKPGRSPNRIELEKNICKDDDNLYVAILTTSNFDAQTVDVSSIKLGDPLLSGTAGPVRSRIRDVDLDGSKDLALAFSLCDLVTHGALNASSSELVLIGRTLDGINISGRDSVIVKADDERFRRVPVFIYPVDGQTLDYEGSYLFKVRPIHSAQGFLWGFFQNGVMIWENYRDERTLSGNEYGIHPGSVAHSKFAQGDVEVWVRASINGKWTDATVITIHLQPRTP